ncbi:heparan-alpha-glucosaminide N-acetyltransferase domain-containing protein [Nesterenkonia jeotgali]|uniref:Putative membrane protein n=1 Tax=Nesterenkonia jeotgali TaxID=317018 RepID=A0A839FNZ4_9MICC|nr:heparan-alpha-glucosaminide N-acetyltransferase domain-containing protein [Nesterenkonia jeotgali]MBA8921219.1 putative membrane protein [Nesterenkonia jeotgali]
MIKAGTTSAHSRRISGVDAARGLALLGMMTVHVLPTISDSGQDASWAGLLFTGRPSALFAMLAGVGLALLTGGAGRGHSGAQLAGYRKAIAVRALLVVVIGLLVAALNSGVAIILVHYGLLFLLALPFLRLGAVPLFTLAGAWVAAAPVAYWWLHNDLRSSWEGFPDMWRLWHSPGVADLANPTLLGMDLALTGYYPLLLWPAYLLTGMAIGRLQLQRTSTALRLAGTGLGLAAASYAVHLWMLFQSTLVPELAARYGWSNAEIRAELMVGTFQIPLVTEDLWFLLATPHQGSTMDLIHTIGTSMLVLGLCLLVAERLRWLLAPLIGAGAMPLTLYVAHLVVIHFWRGAPVPDFLTFLTEYSPMQMLTLMIIGALGAGLLRFILRRRGPLEALTHAAGNAAAGR